jgi:hypothetical protein
MHATQFLRFQFQFAHNWLEGTLQGVNSEVAHWNPGDKVHPIGAQYVHIVTTEDFMINQVLSNSTPLMASTYADKPGFNEAPPMGNRDEWAKRVSVNMDEVFTYGKAVFAATDAYLLSISEDDLDTPLDLSMIGMGMQTVGFLLNLLLLNIYVHSGEISFTKGLQGLVGYPV